MYSQGKPYTVDSAPINQIFCMESLFLTCNASHTVRLFVSLLLSISLPLCPLQLTLFHFLLSLLHILFFSFYNAFYNFSVTLSYSLHFPPSFSAASLPICLSPLAPTVLRCFQPPCSHHSNSYCPLHAGSLSLSLSHKACLPLVVVFYKVKLWFVEVNNS